MTVIVVMAGIVLGTTALSAVVGWSVWFLVYQEPSGELDQSRSEGGEP